MVTEKAATAAVPAGSDAVSNRADLNAKARRGTAWIVIAFGGGQLVRLGVNIALAALLFEEAFALMALITAVLMGLAMFSDLGFQQNVIQSPRGDDPDFLNTVWTLQIARGVLLTLVACLLAWPLAEFYGTNDPMALELKWLIPLAALTALIDGFRSPRVYSAFRHMRVAAMTRMDIAVTVVNTVVILALAWYLRSVYALVIAALVSSLVHVVLSYRWLPGGRARLRLERDALRSIVSFGKWIFLSTILTFLALQIDRLTFSAMYPLAQVGVYSIAASLALMIPNLMGRLEGAVVFPWHARMIDEGMLLPEAFRRTKLPVLVMSTYLVCILVVGAHGFFRLAYDDRYAHAALFLPVLALAAWFTNLTGLYGSAFLVKGLSHWSAMVGAVKVVTFGASLWVLSLFDSTLLMATGAIMVSEAVMALVSVMFARRLGLRSLTVEAACLALLVAVCGALLYVTYQTEFLRRLNPIVELVIVGAAVTLVFAPLFIRVMAPMLRASGQLK